MNIANLDGFQLPWDLDPAAPALASQPVRDLAGQFFARIKTGQYRYGTRLPAERKLAEELGTSRATIRQVLEFLERFDVVMKRAGSGSFVIWRGAVTLASRDRQHEDTAAPPLAETISPFEINITRAIFEPEIARLAAIYMSFRDLVTLGDIAGEMSGIVADADRFADLERQFFMALCEGTHNSLLIAMYRIVHDIRRQPQWYTNTVRSLTPARIKEAQQGLISIYTAIERRNVESAVECMRLYIAAMQEELIYTSP